MSGWHEGPMVAFDIESTSVDTETARIVTACVAHIQPGQPVESMTWLLDPGIDIPEAASAIHGITTEKARNEGQPAHEGVREIADQLASFWADGLPVVGYNLAYDCTLLDRELRRHLGNPLTVGGPVLDPFVIDKGVDRYRRGKRTLTAACEHYGVRHDGAHDATADALAAARVLWALARRHPDLAAMSLLEVHDAQVRWAGEQAASFRQYLIDQSRTEDLPDGQWPIRAWVNPGERAA